MAFGKHFREVHQCRQLSTYAPDLAHFLPNLAQKKYVVTQNVAVFHYYSIKFNQIKLKIEMKT